MPTKKPTPAKSDTKGARKSVTNQKSAPSKGSATSDKTSTAKKSSATKAPTAKKTATAGAPAKMNSITTNLAGEAKQLVQEVIRIAEGLDEAGLALLLKQAQVIEYKGKIEAFNRNLNVVAGQASKARREAAAPDYSVIVERTPDNFFIIQLDKARIFFNRQEMRTITQICHKSRDAADAARRLYRWFEAERSDLLYDAGINSPQSRYFPSLYEIVISTYKVKS